MDIDRLIQEQLKTQEILNRIIKDGTLKKFLENIPPAEEDWGDSNNVDSWDYESGKDSININIANYMNEAYENLRKVKKWSSYMDTVYNGRIREWERIRGSGKDGKPRARGAWKSFYTNPECLKWFEDYEKDHGITKSIYQDYKQEVQRRRRKCV